MAPKATPRMPASATRSRTFRLTVLLCPCTAGAALLLGCGGASPLLHPAHTLKQSELAFGGGATSRFAFSSTQGKIDQAKAIAAANTMSADEEQAFVEGTLLNHSVSPGLSPWGSGRVGLGGNYEAGIAYTGQRLRVDGRHAFESGSMALSVGAGLSLLLVQPAETLNKDALSAMDAGQRLNTEGFDFSSNGWGVDVPVIFGLRSDSRWFEPSIGVRLGYEQLSGDMPLVLAGTSTPNPPPNSEPQTGVSDVTYAAARGHRFSAEGLVGLSAGSAPLFLRLELAGGVQQASGSVDFPGDFGNPQRRTFTLTGLTVEPSAALVLEL